MAKHIPSPVINPECVLHGHVLDEVNDKIDRILVCVEGDNDHVGLKVEVDRLMRACKIYTKVVWLIVGALIVLLVTKLPFFFAVAHPHDHIQ